jgi:List-Bact-rpt repeat protein
MTSISPMKLAIKNLFSDCRSSLIFAAILVFTSACGGGGEEGGSEQTQQYKLTVVASGSGAVTSSPSGINCGETCSKDFDEGSQVSLIAAPSNGYVFSNWSGACSGSDSCSIVMNSDQQATAVFEADSVESFVLNVSVNGSGTVTSSPAGIDCGNDCSESYQSGQSVSLTATPADGFRFTSWSGDCSGSNCSLNMTSNQSVTALFEAVSANTFNLSVVTTGSGTVTSSPAGIDCGNACTQSFAENTAVSLSASPAQGFQFVGWAGACSGSGACDVSMTSDLSVTATFEQSAAETFNLNVTVTSGGVVTSNPAGIDCGSDCDEIYQSGTLVTLFATANSGFKLDRWSGDCSGNVDCSVTMSAARSVTATFVEDNGQTGSLSIAPMGNFDINHGDIFTFQPEITGDATICRKDLGHDDVKVDSETGKITWDTSSLAFGRGFYIRIKCSNFNESVYASMVVHVDKSGTSQLRVAGQNGVSQYIGVAGLAMTSGDTIVFPDGEYPVSVTRDESYENAFNRNAPTSGTQNQYSTIIAQSPGGVVINGQAHDGIGKQKKAFELGTNSYLAIAGFVVKNVQRESFTTKGTNTKLLLDFIGGQGAGTWGLPCGNFSDSGNGRCSNAGMRINGGTAIFQNSYDWGHNRYGIMTRSTTGSITRRSFVRLDEHKGDQPYGGFSNYCDTLHLSQDNTVFDSLAIAAPHYKTYAGLEAYPATGCENTAATLKTVGLLAVNNKLSLSLMDVKAGPNHIWDYIVSYDSEGTCTPQTNRCGLWLLQADKSVDVSNSYFGKARGFEGGTGISQAFGNNVSLASSVTINDVPGESDTGTAPSYLPESQLYYRGRYDTFHGDEGYDSLTTARRWPIAGEDIIAANMRSYRNPTALKVGGGTVDINGDRGAAATGESMSEYFWGYTNDKIPPLVVRVKDKGAVKRVAWEHLTGSRRDAVTGWKVVCVSSGNTQLAVLSASQLVYDDDSSCTAYGVKASYANGDSGIAYTETAE